MKFYLLKLADRIARARGREALLPGRELIAEKPRAGAKVEASCSADCWLDAKAKLGFELTPLQVTLLEKSRKAAACKAAA